VEGNVDVRNTDIVLDFGDDKSAVAARHLKLIDVVGDDAAGTYEISSLKLQDASGNEYELELASDDPRDLMAVLNTINPSGPVYERVKAYTAGRIAAQALINQGQDIIINRGIAGTLTATRGGGLRVGAFGGVEGGWSRYADESQVDIASQTVIAGIGIGTDVAIGRVSLGGFLEAGFGNYASLTGTSASGNINGNGDTSYYGGGAILRLDTTPGIYLEASGRAGVSRLDFFTSDVKQAKANTSYESTALYFGAHGGIGWAGNIPGTEGRLKLDVSARVLWSNLQGDTMHAINDVVRFESADSLRLRGGGRLTYVFDDCVTAFAGGYFEQEIASKQIASKAGRNVVVPVTKEGTTIGEAGFTLRPTPELPLYIDIGLQGFMGKRLGAGGNVLVRMEY
jgi:hypothetical protein